MGMRLAAQCARCDPSLTLQAAAARMLWPSGNETRQTSSSDCPDTCLSSRIQRQSWRLSLHNSKQARRQHWPRLSVSTSRCERHSTLDVDSDFRRPQTVPRQSHHHVAWAHRGRLFKRSNIQLPCRALSYSTAFHFLAHRAATPLQPTGSEEFGRTSAGLRSLKVEEWTRTAIDTRKRHGPDAAWCQLGLLFRNDIWILAELDADVLRREVLWAAAENDERLNELLYHAQRLATEHDYRWPHLYAEIMFRLLRASSPERSVSWHTRLYSDYPPDPNVFATLLCRFSAGASRSVLRELFKLYVLSSERQLYDEIVPRLFRDGFSKSALAWRSQLLKRGDLPRKHTSQPFVQFLAQYFPPKAWTEYEQALLTSPRQVSATVSTRTICEETTSSQTLLARWFASSWVSVDFAISLVQRFGVTRIGPRALQALALRAPDTQSLQQWFHQLRDLNIAIEPTTYCKLIENFANNDEKDMLEDLLSSDVHPEEFQDVETIRMLLTAALENHDQAQQRLMRAILRFIDRDPVVPETALEVQKTGVAIRQKLDAAFRHVRWHPSVIAMSPRHKQAVTRNFRALDLAYEALNEGVGVPTEYWQKLLFNFGRLGQFKELEDMSLSILRFYEDPDAKSFAVHWKDVPNSRETGRTAEQQRSLEEAADGLQKWQEAVRHSFQDINRREVRAHDATTLTRPDGEIPRDLSFSHPQHPMRLIFTARLQRSILRWCFDAYVKQTQTSRRAVLAENMDSVSMGLRLLRTLRDAGVPVYKSLVQSALVSRVSVAMFRNRRSQQYDLHELDLDYLMQLFSRGWGSPLFTSRSQLETLLTARNPITARNYPRDVGGDIARMLRKPCSTKMVLKDSRDEKPRRAWP